MARRSVASPLAIFLDYILTTEPASAQAAIEASIAALGARMRVIGASKVARTRGPAAAPAAAPAATPAAAERTGPVAVPTPAAAPARRRGRPTGSGAAKTAKAPKAPKATAATRRRRPAVDAPAVSVPVEDLPPSHTPLPEQIVEGDDASASGTSV